MHRGFIVGKVTTKVIDQFLNELENNEELKIP